MAQTHHRRPFAHLNLTRNPFGQFTQEERKSCIVADTKSYRSFLEEPGRALEFVAPGGRGKTTHLQALHNHYSDALFVRVNSDDQDLPDQQKKPLIFVDEFHFLSPAERGRIYSQWPALVIAAHTSYQQEMSRDGFHVHTERLQEYSLPTIQKMFSRRIQHCRREEGTLPELSDRTIQTLVDRYGDNIRAMKYHLYHVFQELEEIRILKPRDLDRVEDPPEQIVNPPLRTRNSRLLSYVIYWLNYSGVFNG